MILLKTTLSAYAKTSVTEPTPPTGEDDLRYEYFKSRQLLTKNNSITKQTSIPTSYEEI